MNKFSGYIFSLIALMSVFSGVPAAAIQVNLKSYEGDYLGTNGTLGNLYAQLDVVAQNEIKLTVQWSDQPSVEYFKCNGKTYCTSEHSQLTFLSNGNIRLKEFDQVFEFGQIIY